MCLSHRVKCIYLSTVRFNQCYLWQSIYFNAYFLFGKIGADNGGGAGTPLGSDTQVDSSWWGVPRRQPVCQPTPPTQHRASPDLSLIAPYLLAAQTYNFCALTVEMNQHTASSLHKYLKAHMRDSGCLRAKGWPVHFSP